MFGRKKKQSEKKAHDAVLLELIYDVRDNLARERKLLNTITDDERQQQKTHVAMQEGLFDFLHRQARIRRVSEDQVESFSVLHNLEQINK